MPAFSIKKAREGNVITDKELERFGVLFMICQDQLKISGKQYEQAAADYGGTAGSFKFACYSAFKKLKENNCYVDGEGPAEGENAAETTTKKKGGPKKRKAAEGDEVDGEKSAKKGRGGKKKDAVKTEDEAADEY